MSYELREETRRREKEQRKLAAEHERLLCDMRAVASTAEGARVLAWLIGQGNIFAEEYAPGMHGAYAAGKRTTALRLWKMLGAVLPPGQFVTVTGMHNGEDATHTQGE